ncbi:unnamed protein product [Sphagnum jensenii]|uniref:AB hydrolase-1 domain-containing protein n=1 Tax=Sphagnum jensenii TaxID=128206 RepID=A0ABP1BQ69_9BRYO
MGSEQVAARKGPRISASSARSHTRNKPNNNPKRTLPSAFAGLLRRFVLVLIAAAVGLVYKAITPPPVKVLNSINGPQVTAQRVQLPDGRFLAYEESGVPAELAKVNVISIHGYGGSRHSTLPASKDLVEKLGIHFVTFDRAGYGQSDPNPKRSIKSDALDVDNLANALSLGPSFYVIATSIGGYTGWGLIKYIPERVAGIAMLAPVTNFWWPGIPAQEAKTAWDTQLLGDKLALRVAHYAPWLVYWYMTQSLFPTSSTAPQTKVLGYSKMDTEIIAKVKKLQDPKKAEEVTQQGKFESLYRDVIIMFSNWEFEPADLKNPFEKSSKTVHIWQGTDDYLVPFHIQRYIAKRLPWVRYHELDGYGHVLHYIPGLVDQVLQELLADDEHRTDAGIVL